MTAIYIIIKYLTFPGAYIRCMLEQIICRIWKVPVEDNRCLRKDETVSHVEHEFMPTVNSAFFFCFIPSFLCILGAIVIGLIPTLFTVYARINDLALTLVNLLGYWFAVSLFVNAFALVEDVWHMTESVYKKGNILQKVIFAPGVAFNFIGAYLEKYSITFLIALAFTLYIYFS